MANLSRNGSDALTEVHNPDNLNYDLFNQSEQIMTSSEQSNDVSQTETDITSDSNIIPYSQYLSETQQETVQNSNSSAQQDVLILSMFEQLRQYAEIVRLKQNLFEQVQEKDSLMKTVSELKNDLKLEENRNIDREIALEKKIKQLDNIIFKRGQSAQTVHMMTKSKICYDHSSKQAIGFEKPFYLKKARESKPKLYDGNTILKMDTIVIPDSDETLMLSEESRSKMLLKEQDPFEHAYWKATSVPALDPSHSSTTVIVEVPKELPTKEPLPQLSLALWGLKHKRLVFEMKSFVYKRIKDIFNNSQQYLVEELTDVQKVFYQMEQTIEQHRLESRTFEVKMNQVLSENELLLAQAIDKDILFELSELRAQSQAKDTVIVKLKEQIKSLNGNVDESTVKMDMDEIETLNEQEHREQGLVIAALKNELRKLKGKALDNEDTVTHSVDPKVSKDNMEPIIPKLLNKRTAHSSYIKHTQEEALVLRDIVEHVKANYPQDSLLESAFRYTKVIQDLLSHISRSCPSINNFGPQLVEVTPRKKDKKVRFAESLTSTENTKTDSTSNIVSNKRVLHSTGVRLSTSASGSQPSGNTKNDRILQTPSSNSKNKVEAHPRNVKSSLNKRNGTVKVNGSAVVQNLKKQDNSDYVCINSDDCMSSDNLCVSNSMNYVKFRAKPKKKKITERYLETNRKGVHSDRIYLETYRNLVNLGIHKKPIFPLFSEWMPGCPSLSSVKFGNDQVAKIMGYGDYQIGNVTISRVYYVEGLGHNLFSMGQFCDSNLEVAFRQHTCFIRNLEGVDLLTGSRGITFIPLSTWEYGWHLSYLSLSKASKTKFGDGIGLLSHLNFVLQSSCET
ncbi:hypothetical protein Tco_0686666 [Tanacetum coccineum]